MNEVLRERRRAAAEKAMNDQITVIRRAEKIFGTERDRGGRLGKLIELGDDSFVGEVHGGWWNSDPAVTTWMVAVAGKKISEAFPSQELALLGYVELLHNGGNVNPRGWEFAARALGVPLTNEEN